MKIASPLVALAAALLPCFAFAVDINSADAGTLARELQGIGPARAEAIVAYRQQNGPFKSVDDLAKVKGISAKVIDQNRSSIQVGGGRSGKADGKSDKVAKDGGKDRKSENDTP